MMRATQILRAARTDTTAVPRQLTPSGPTVSALTSMTLEGPITSFPPPWEYARTHINWTDANVLYLGDGATMLPANEHGITINTGFRTLIRYSMWARLGTYGAAWAMASYGTQPGQRWQIYDAYAQVPSIIRYVYNGVEYDGLQGGIARYEGMFVVGDQWSWQMGINCPGHTWSVGFAAEIIGEETFAEIGTPGG